MTQIINGREIAQSLCDNLKKEISELKNKHDNVPGLVAMLCMNGLPKGN